MPVYLHLVDDICSHVYAVVEFVESRHKDLFHYLHVAEVTHGQVVGNHHNLLWQSLQFVAFGPDELKHVRVFLVRHDGTACGAFLRQFNEAEVLTIKQACIKSHLRQGGGHGSHGCRHVALHLTPAHLGIDHVVVHGVETQQLGGHSAVERE